MFIKPYSGVASVYDFLLQHVDYDRWYQYLRTLMFQYIEDPQTVLELGCGTGKFGAKFSKDDFTIFGMDKSMDMLAVARIRAYRNYRIFCGDMTNFHLAKKIDFIFCVHDTMNYILEPGDIRKVFRSVRQVMHDKSIFMFDITTEYNIKRFFDGQKKEFRFNKIDITWDNNYDNKTMLIYSSLTLMRRDGTSTTETHVQRIYPADVIAGLLAQEGLEVIDIFSDYTFLPVKNDTIMINFVTRKA